jgi:hypothetical protein
MQNRRLHDKMHHGTRFGPAVHSREIDVGWVSHRKATAPL